MYRHIPGLFRFGYGFAERHPDILKEEAALYKLLTGGTEQLFAYIQDGNYDTVICTHVFSSLLLRQMLKEHPVSLQTAFVATDYTCSPGAAKSELDHYFIPADSLAAEFIAQGVPAEKIIACGIPVCKEIYTRIDHAKQKAGVSPEHSHLLMMCGSMGCGPLAKLAKLLCESMDDAMELSIVCGTNEKLRNELTEEFASLPHVHIYGFVNHIACLMDSADLYLTKPGGLSTTEAAIKHLPMVLIDAVAGCEDYNLSFFVQLGGALTGDTPEALSQICIDLMRSKDRLTQMRLALTAMPNHNAAKIICETIRRKAGVL